MNVIALMVFPVLMAFAAASDLLTMRISNRLILAALAGFAIVAPLAGLPLDVLGIHLLTGIAVLFVAFTFFAFGWIGGGDAKLVAAIALWFGFPLSLEFLVLSAVFGGALTLAFLLARRVSLPARLYGVEWVERLHNSRSGIPYGIALAAAALILYPQTQIFMHFAV